MLDKGDVSKLVLVTNKNLVRVYIKKDSLDKSYYKDKLGKSYQVVKTEGPQFEFQVTKIDDFEKRMSDFFAQESCTRSTYVTRTGRRLDSGSFADCASDPDHPPDLDNADA